jgi:hypothetical protein
MSSNIKYSATSLVDKHASTRSYIPMDVFMKRLKKQTDFDYYCDFLYIDKCDGEFPDLSNFKYARRVFITNCKIQVYPSTLPIPNWIESLSIEFTDIRELPKLSANLTRLYISRTSIERLPLLLHLSLFELILEHNPKLEKIPPLPHTLNKLICVNSAIRELPVIPPGVFTLFCWKNQLVSLPEIPRNLRYLQCAGNPFTSMPWINDLHYTETPETAVNHYRIKCSDFRRICRFREIYFAVRLRERFRRWLWRPIERKAMEEMSPARLTEFIQNATPENMESVLDMFYALYV